MPERRKGVAARLAVLSTQPAVVGAGARRPPRRPGGGGPKGPALRGRRRIMRWPMIGPVSVVVAAVLVASAIRLRGGLAREGVLTCFQRGEQATRSP